MGNKTNLIEEIRLRLATATGAGQALEGVKQVRVGFVETNRKENDFPIINVSLLSGVEEPKNIPHGFTDTMDIEVRLIVNKKATELNKMYDLINTDGGVDFLERVLNTLDKNISGDVDLLFGCNANNLRSYSYEITQNEFFIHIAITLAVETKEFQAGNR